MTIVRLNKENRLNFRIKDCFFAEKIDGVYARKLITVYLNMTTGESFIQIGRGQLYQCADEIHSRFFIHSNRTSQEWSRV